ncbi:MAG TPA: MBL fold metallo-hydrolase [Pseudorhizobium sp.]|nr:MBL fold metallo-hydrolase [Pseudorhizobium sp.]
MPMIGRRALLGSAGAGIVAAPALLRGEAKAQETERLEIDRAMPPQTDRFNLGSFEVLVVKDGARASGAPNETFGTDQSAEAVGELLQENFLPADQFVNSFAPVLVNTGSEVVLFDTGMGPGGRAQGMGRLIEGLTAGGYSPEDVSIVVLTHLHGDHIGGLMEDSGPAFPNARYVTGQAEYDFWTDTARVGTAAENGHKSVLEKVQPLADKMTFVSGEAEVVPGIASMEAFGHTPGHMIYNLESDGRRLVITADTANHYVLSLQRPDWEVRFDMDKAMAAQTRKKVFDMLATDKVAFLGYHMPFPSVGYVEKLETGYRFVPKTYQFEI